MMTFDKVREFALSLPEVYEKPSYGTPSFRIGKRQVVRLLEDGERIILNCSELYRHALVKAKPETFSIPAHYEKYNIVVVRLENVDTNEFKTLFTEAWHMVAPKKLLEKTQ
jgi:hypothetical protein